MSPMVTILLLTMSFQEPATAKDTPCKECRAKSSQKTNDIFFGKVQGELLHIGHYLGGRIETWLSGPEEGLQIIYVGNDEIARSTNMIRLHEDEFTHTYPRYKICSSAKEQWIKILK